MGKVNRYLAPLLAAGAGAVAVALAPVAAAEPTGTSVVPNCTSIGPGTECQSPGNVELNASLPPDFESQYPAFGLFGLGPVGPGFEGHGFGGGAHGFGGGAHGGGGHR
ncbi:hypothetical protein [Mycolicibacterium goodii]|uniref:hypothetical protein n=1 Tax=Mycolicibacterium goodii TaxID=134601 RepID=UPI000C25F9C2|nr:hypothetical protein [Mycolicibacterium goodii]MBU8812597.1 hypothetical protein [Mycolicibacterium goodii]MBU8819730.1 hypothetical protein [Mycolicibacterium goodii]MBU8830089.1 hypothetical protein [Mycolicibacterium goodii]PJK24345.1 hypothetical protein CSX11_00285 [Mycolicibacterium goodii]ULN46421.1 hypothetical protein MI170_24465 [Mycolicibacterium goodii]